MAVSTKQAVALVEVYDYYQASGDPANTTSGGRAGKRVKVTLNYSLASSTTPITALDPAPINATTDANGFWHVFVTPTDQINPSGVLYQVEVQGGRSYLINPIAAGVPGIGWQSSAILVNAPTGLGPSGFTLPGGTTVNGALTVQGVLVAGSTGGVFIDANGNVAARSFTARSGSSPYTPAAAALAGIPGGYFAGEPWI